MDNVINEYQRWKQQGESLRVQARQAMETRFRDLLNEAARISQEYQADFGTALKPPPAITAFRFKPVAGKSAKKAPAAKSAPKSTETPAASPVNPETAGLEKKLAQARTKLEALKAAGKPTRNTEDRIYEIEDALRLAHN